MYISKLVLQGFKSFLKRTEVEFGQGITAVVGPNGCGKTNIIDAIRWVIGEQKASVLRSERITDVIFNGTATRRPLNVAEVSLVIHNISGRMPIAYTDVEITRRLYRNGESEYFINRNLCRLKDITDLFLDTGMGANAYSIIELKMIEDLLSETPEERKRLFEEAAGVNKYRLQRKAALRKLEATHEDLVRLNDIIGEVENGVRNLKRQLQRYEKYQEITQKLIEAEVQLASRRVLDLRLKYRPIQTVLATKQERYDEVARVVKDLEKEMQEQTQALKVRESELQSKRLQLENINAQHQQTRTNLLVIQEQLRHQQQNLTRLNSELNQLTAHKAKTEQRTQEVRQELELLAQQLEAKRQQFKQISGEGDSLIQSNQETSLAIQKLQDERFHLMRAQAEQSARQRSLQDNIQSRQAELENVLRQIATLQNQQTTTTQQLESAQARLAQWQKERDDSRQKINAVSDQLTQIINRREQLLDEFRQIDSELDRLNNRIQFYQGIIQSKEGFEPGLQYVLENRDQFPGILGALSDLIATEPRYYPAVEAVLKDIARLLVAEDKTASLKAIDRLSQLKKGRITLLPLDISWRPPQRHLKDSRLQPLSRFLTCGRELENLKEFLFGQVYLCPDEQFEDWIRDDSLANLTLVTEKGRLRDEYGGLSGGATAAEAQQLVGRQAKLAEYTQKYAHTKAHHDEIKQQIQHLETQIKELRAQQQTEQGNLTRLEQHLQQVESERKKGQDALAQLSTRIQSLTEQKVAIQTVLETFTAKLTREEPLGNETATKLQQLEAELAQLSAVAKNKKAELDAWNSRTQNSRIELLNLEHRHRSLNENFNALQNSLKTTALQIKQNETERNTLQAQINDLTQQAAQISQQVEQLRTSLEQVKKEYTDSEQLYQQQRLDLDNLNRRLTSLRQEKEALSTELKQLELDLANFQARENEITAVLSQKYNRSIPSEIDPQLPTEAEAQQAVERQKHQLEQIGTVNLAVKEEYEQEKARLDFLTEQRDDLVESEKGLNDVIQQIDKIAREQFVATFEQIRSNFKTTFDIFFGGGEAELKLIGSEDPLEADVEIWACPGGKKMRTLRMLSAGEKALTAIALLFAIYQVKPSPFCILDEVDAPLDDENIRRFANVIKTFAQKTQFIIVTHNKTTMTIADTLYGVTMGEKGVSQIVSVRLE